MTTHQVLGGKIQLYRRDNSPFWQCSASVGGKQRRTSTKETSVTLTKQIAEDWYLGLIGKSRAGLLLSEMSFEQTALQFLKEYEIITEGQRSPVWVKGQLRQHRHHIIRLQAVTGAQRQALPCIFIHHRQGTDLRAIR